MTKTIIHAVVLIIAIVLAFILPKTSLANYDLQMVALLFIVLYLSKKFFIGGGSSSRLIESVVFTIIVISIINTTGGVSSPFFFLVYFLLFSLSLLLEPLISTTTTVALIIFYLFSLPQNQDLKTLLPIFSLAFITPFALFLGQEHKKSEKLKFKNQKIKEDSLLFISLLLKNHLKNIKEAAENFVGDNQLDSIKKSASRMEKLIDKYEKQ